MAMRRPWVYRHTPTPALQLLPRSTTLFPTEREARRTHIHTHTHRKCADPCVSDFTALLAICVSCGQLGKLQSVTQLCSCNWSQGAGKQSPPAVLRRSIPITRPSLVLSRSAPSSCGPLYTYRPRLRPLQTPELSARTELLSCAAVDVHVFPNVLQLLKKTNPQGSRSQLRFNHVSDPPCSARAPGIVADAEMA